MEELGVVSIWLGNFESREALAFYAENRFKRNENGEKVPSFTQDFFEGDLWPFEPEVFDYEFSGEPAVVANPLGEELSRALAIFIPRASTSPTMPCWPFTTTSSRAAAMSPAHRPNSS